MLASKIDRSGTHLRRSSHTILTAGLICTPPIFKQAGATTGQQREGTKKGGLRVVSSSIADDNKPTRYSGKRL